MARALPVSEAASPAGEPLPAAWKRWMVPLRTESLVVLGLLVGGSASLAGILEDVITRDSLVMTDSRILSFLQAARTPSLDCLMTGVTMLGSSLVLVPLILAVLGGLLIRRQWLMAVCLASVTGLAELVVKLLKGTIQRPRPELVYQGVERFSFPSGHATMSVVVYGFLAYLAFRKATTGLRTAVFLVAILLVLLIGFSRLYLGVHWFSDVAGGLSLGIAWAAASAMVYSRLAR